MLAVSGGVTYAPGEVGNAFAFDGGNASYVNIADAPALNVTTGATWGSSLIAGQETLRIYAIAVSPTYARDRRIYLGLVGTDVTGFGLVRSTNGGRTWRDVLIWKRIIGRGGDWMLTTNIVVTPATRRVLTNRLVRVGAALAIDPRAPHHLYLGTESLGVLRSLDGGASWLRSLATIGPHRLFSHYLA